jgi:hypothetical protein
MTRPRRSAIAAPRKAPRNAGRGPDGTARNAEGAKVRIAVETLGHPLAPHVTAFRSVDPVIGGAAHGLHLSSPMFAGKKACKATYIVTR